MKFFYLTLYVFTTTFHSTLLMPHIKNVKQPDYPDFVIKYLQTYDYLQTQEKHDKVNIFKALLKFQKFTGLRPTGLLTLETEKLMKKPRCAELDVKSIPKSKHFFKKSASKYAIKFSILRWSRFLPRAVQNTTILKAINSWKSKIPVDVNWADQNANVKLFLVDDQANKSGTITAQDSVFTKVVSDENRAFTIYILNNANVTVTQLLHRASHALGHVFGFSHGNVSSNMFPIFNLKQFNQSAIDRKCLSSIDSVSSSMADGKTYFFKGSKYWRLIEEYETIKNVSYPKNIADKWKGVPDAIDESFLWADNWQMYFFKDNKYYKYNGSTDKVLPGYPKLISQGWRGIPDNIDAAFTDHNGISYFFKGSQLYKYDNSRDQVAYGYPMKIESIFHGLPHNIDSAFRYYYDNEVYFFKGNQYYKWSVMYNQAEGPFSITSDWSVLCNN